MTDSPTYAYLGRWNYSLQKPVPDESWITEDQARADYASCTVCLDIVSGDTYTVHEGTRPSPPWVITTFGGVLSGFRVHHLTTQGSVRLDIQYKHFEGRLFLSSVTEYTYPNDDRYYRRYECTNIVDGIMKPDGTGFRTINDKSRPTVDLLSIDQIDVLSNWLGRPAFGDWHVLLDPDFGARPTSPGPDSEKKPRRRRAWSPFRKR